MEEHVNGVLEIFFRGLSDNYLMQNEKESFLYRAVPSLKNQKAGSRASLRWTLLGGTE